MKRFRAAAILLIAGFAAYHFFFSDRAESAYKRFAEEVLQRHYDAAAKMTTGMTAADLEKLGSQERIGAGPPMFQHLFPSRFEVKSRTKSADGSVVLHATQTVLFNPVGVESAIRPAMYAKLNQVVTLQKSDGEWKITAFENKFDSMDSMTGR